MVLRALALGLWLTALSCVPVTHGAESFTGQRQMGLKYSPLTQVNTSTVEKLQLVWEYHTGDIGNSKTALEAFEDEPSLIDGSLVVCTIWRRLIALDPETGKQRWVYDPKTDRSVGMRKCRGISAWIDRLAPPGSSCKTRIFMGTADYRLVAIDAHDGRPCSGFGTNGEVHMPVNKPQIFP